MKKTPPSMDAWLREAKQDPTAEKIGTVVPITCDTLYTCVLFCLIGLYNLFFTFFFEEFMQIIDLDKMGDNMEVAKMLVKTYNKIKPLLQDIFPGVTDEELDRVKIKELIPVVIQIGESIADSLNILNPGNLTRA